MLVKFKPELTEASSMRQLTPVEPLLSTILGTPIKDKSSRAKLMGNNEQPREKFSTSFIDWNFIFRHERSHLALDELLAQLKFIALFNHDAGFWNRTPPVFGQNQFL